MQRDLPQGRLHIRRDQSDKQEGNSPEGDVRAKDRLPTQRLAKGGHLRLSTRLPWTALSVASHAVSDSKQPEHF